MGFLHLSRDVRRAGPEPPDGARPATPEAGRAFDSPWNAVNRDYFHAMGVRLLAGRIFSDSESYDAAAPPVAILDEVLARRLWPAGNALGERIQFASRARRPHRLRRRRHRRGHALGAVRTRAAGRRVRAAGPRRTRADVLPRAASRVVAGPCRGRPARRPRGRAGLAAVQRAHLRRPPGRLDRVLGARPGQRPLHRVRCRRDGRGAGWPLRGDGPRRRAADPRNRHSHRRWRGPGGSAPDDPRREPGHLDWRRRRRAAARRGRRPAAGHRVRRRRRLRRRHFTIVPVAFVAAAVAAAWAPARRATEVNPTTALRAE